MTLYEYETLSTGKLPLEHAAVWPELLDAVVHERRHRLCQLLGADWLVAFVPVEAGTWHSDAAELDGDVRALCDGGDAAAPGGEHLIVVVAVRPDPEQASDVVQDDLEIGYRLGEVGQLR